jgi:ribosomal protein S18 acetylase RimI-like enzyme
MHSSSSIPALRPAALADTPFLRSLYRSTREVEMAAVPWTEMQKAAFCDMQFNLQTAGYAQAFPGAEHLMICTPHGEPAGRLIKARLADALQLVDIALLPAWRGRGWGGWLIGALQQEAAGLQMPVQLTVEKINPALTLYRRLGFVVTGEDDLRFRMRWEQG